MGSLVTVDCRKPPNYPCQCPEGPLSRDGENQRQGIGSDHCEDSSRANGQPRQGYGWNSCEDNSRGLPRNQCPPSQPPGCQEYGNRNGQRILTDKDCPEDGFIGPRTRECGDTYPNGSDNGAKRPGIDDEMKDRGIQVGLEENKDGLCVQGRTQIKGSPQENSRNGQASGPKDPAVSCVPPSLGSEETPGKHCSGLLNRVKSDENCCRLSMLDRLFLMAIPLAMAFPIVFLVNKYAPKNPFCPPPPCCRSARSKKWWKE